MLGSLNCVAFNSRRQITTEFYVFSNIYKTLTLRSCTKKYFASVNPHNHLVTQLVGLHYFAAERITPGPDECNPRLQCEWGAGLSPLPPTQALFFLDALSCFKEAGTLTLAFPHLALRVWPAVNTPGTACGVLSARRSRASLRIFPGPLLSHALGAWFLLVLLVHPGKKQRTVYRKYKVENVLQITSSLLQSTISREKYCLVLPEVCGFFFGGGVLGFYHLAKFPVSLSLFRIRLEGD